MKQVEEKERIIGGWLGVSIQKVTPEIKEKFGLRTTEGALIGEVTKGGPAKKGGLKRGDVIISFDGRRVKEIEDLPPMVVKTPVGKKVEIIAIRRGKEKRIMVNIGGLKEEKRRADITPPAIEITSPRMEPGVGITIKNKRFFSKLVGRKMIYQNTTY
jgi:serine protease Do